jgi:hypothetical protein
MDIKIEYDGRFPNLCSGHLKVTIDGREWDFGKYCMTSGGSVSFDQNWSEHITSGPWSVAFPEEFPDDYKDTILYLINLRIPHGCCGGCV